jgi:hypothetical protein
VTFQLYFKSTRSPSSLIGYSREHLGAAGWHGFRPLVDNGLPGGEWSLNLRNGTVANAQLGAEAYGGWTMIATAAPIGRPVSGC